jgi:probable rRNA maturation factor
MTPGKMTQDDQQSEDDSPPRSSSGLEIFIKCDHDGWREVANGLAGGVVRSDPSGLETADLDALVCRAVEAALSAFEPAPMTLSVVLTGDAEVRALNKTHLGKDKPTNVLSFPAAFSEPDGPEALGDVILAFETVRAEADDQGKSLTDHLTHLVIHGTLHLMGLDHQNSEEAEEMEALERLLLGELGIDDPYSEPLEPDDGRPETDPATGKGRAA